MEIVEEAIEGGIHRINLSGRLDFQGVETISTRFTGMTASPRTAVIVDLSAVSFLSSLGLRMFVMNAKAMNKRGGKLVLLNPDSNARGVLTSSGIAQLIPVCDTLQDAKHMVGSPDA